MAPRVVYDTMVFLQAAIHPDRRYATIEAVEDMRLTLCTSLELIAEVRDVLTRPALAAKFPALNQIAPPISSIASAFYQRPLPTVPNVFSWPQHPDDDHLFNLAIGANAAHLVTWETRILNLATDSTPAAILLRRLAPNLSIITPKQLAELLKTQTP